MIASDREWYKGDGASAEALALLRNAAPVDLPDEYIQLLAFSNGGEGPLPVSPYNFCLDPAEEVTKVCAERAYEEFFAGFVIIGGNGAGEFIAFDVRGTKPWPIVAIDMTNINLAESVEPVAPDFNSFLSFIGLSKTD